MFRSLLIFAFGALLITACAATRKVSQVGVRELSSLNSAQLVSERRQRISEQKDFPKECPADLLGPIKALALENVDFPACPESLSRNLQTLLAILKSEERTAIEEALSSQCRSLGSVADGTSLDAVFPPNELRNLASRFPDGSAEGRALAEAQAGINYLVEHHLPLDRWVKQNGGFLLSDDLLSYLDKVIVVRKCRLSDGDMDSSFQVLRGIEDLERVLMDGPQKQELSRLLQGLYFIQDRKIEEFFRP